MKITAKKFDVKNLVNLNVNFAKFVTSTFSVDVLYINFFCLFKLIKMEVRFQDPSQETLEPLVQIYLEQISM